MIALAAPPLRSWIRPELVLPDLAATSANEVLTALAQVLSDANPAVRSEQAQLAFLEREHLGSTGVGEGCAIPHCRLAGLNGLMLVVARTGAGVEFGAADGRLVRLFFGLAAPTGAATQHLQVLSSIARWLRDRARCEALLAAPDRTAMVEILSAD